jgi:large subunit ribosomal protein L6
MPINIPAKVNVTIEGKTVKAKGPLGELSYTVPEEIDFKIEDGVMTFSRTSEHRKVRSLHGLARSLTANVINGVDTGFTKVLQIEGVGYKVEMKGDRLFLSLGYSHPILVIPPKGLSFETPNVTTIKIHGIDKQAVGQIASMIRDLRRPEPYKGKGIRYEGEYIRRKAGKTAA